tara:strand:+ start:382 stop:525 length:144 start_codon:yes stop_codon:yes gene_type:complete
MNTKKKKPSTKSTYPKPKGWELKELQDEFHRGPEVALLREPSKRKKR